MGASGTLHALLDGSARRTPGDTAVEEPGCGSMTYGELAELSDRLRDRLVHLGVRPGDRVGVYLRKSLDAVATIFGILKAGACYVPLDVRSPLERCAYILRDCAVRVVVVAATAEAGLRRELGAAGAGPGLYVLDGGPDGASLRAALERDDRRERAAPAGPVAAAPDRLAYILYTSGSTGKPKGVMLSHRSARSFVDWCSEAFEPSPRDRFSSHAPFHFDLSVLDIYVPIKHGATVVLIGDEEGRDPLRLAPLISEQRISVWYSTPSILALLAQYGQLGRHDYSSLRLVLFAGEVFPMKHFTMLQRLLPHPRYWNLYGPTETNVCTAYPVPGVLPVERTEPLPIGSRCAHLQTKVVTGDGAEVPPGGEGELVVSGPGVMSGYWGLPELTAKAFLGDPAGRWYRTGDVVVEGPDGHYRFLGRRDRMVKRRGFRVELGEIEACLYRHAAIEEAADVALTDGNDPGSMRVTAFVACSRGKRPSIIELKRFCIEHLPAYMVPDVFVFKEALPKTSTDKVDYQRLREG